MIEDYTFGKISIRGKIYHTDIKIINGAVYPDWWRKDGHAVDIEDIKDILEAKPDILVIGKGNSGYMEPTQQLRDTLKELNIELVEEKTSKAVKIVNKLRHEGKNVAAGFHLTC